MNPSFTQYNDHANCVSHFSRNLASTAWAIFTPLHMSVLSKSMCTGYATNNQAEYDAVIGLLVDALAHHILHLHVHLIPCYLSCN